MANVINLPNEDIPPFDLIAHDAKKLGRSYWQYKYTVRSTKPLTDDEIRGRVRNLTLYGQEFYFTEGIEGEYVTPSGVRETFWQYEIDVRIDSGG